MRDMKRCASAFLAFAMVASLAGCDSGSDEKTTTTAKQEETTASAVAEESTTSEETTATEETTSIEETTEAVPADGNYIDLALNVYFNDSDHNYYANEEGASVRITEDGQYTVAFDCATDLSSKAADAGVSALVNLTAIYVKDAGVASGNQSPLKAANIMYDKIVVDGTELTITMTEPKSAFKASGVFDTNDPVNGWDGSCVEEVSTDTANHVANFSTVENPARVELTFTLSGMNWTGVEDNTGDDVVSDNTYVNTAKFSDMDFTDYTALELSVLMGNGINLGNTMEAYGRATLGTGASVSSYETYWGQPVTTAAMIQGMKNCGFDNIRIPIAWTNAMNYENGDYTINEEYMDRIQELVDYAIDAEMFVIINDHWDGGWWAKFGSSEQEDVDAAFEMYTQMWQQICERFKDYNDMLIFESANEEFGEGLNNNSEWPASGYLTADGLYEMTNRINQTFVDVVRASGGNNDDRFLLIAGYNTDIDKTCDDRFAMPTDTANSKLFLSVHYYTPWNYCGVDKDSRWGLKSEYEFITEQIAKMTKFTDQGYGIIIGEYAALPYWEDNSAHLKSNTYEFTKAVLDICDINNFVPVLWSCNDLYKKDTLNMASDELTKLYTSRCYAEEVAAGDGYLDAVAASLAEDTANALEKWPGVVEVEEGTPMAWIMWNGGAGTYSVGDTYNPSDNTDGITATDVLVEGAGTYTVSLDFAGGNTGLTFSALAINSAETLWPGGIIDIKEILIDGEPATLIAKPYTCSDDKVTTRVNLLNVWVTKIPKDARTADGDLTDCSTIILDKTALVDIKNITITFEFIVPAE